MQSATDDDYQTVKHSFIHLIGAAWERYVEWATVDPAGTNHRRQLSTGRCSGGATWDDHAATDEALCGTCDIANFARRFYFHANLPLFRRLAPERNNLQRGPERQPLGSKHLRRCQPAGEPILRRPGHGIPRGPAVLR